MAGFEVDPADLAAVADEMNTINQVIDAQMSQLMNQLSNLSTLWRGPAAKSFDDALTNWAARASEHNQRLVQISATLMATSDDYSTVETGNTAGLRRMNSPT